jgi:hypothetical protein
VALPTTWPRPHYEQTDGDAFVLFAIFGQLPTPDMLPPLSKERYRSLGATSGIVCRKLDVERMASLRDGLSYAWRQFSEQDAEAAQRVHQCRSCFTVEATLRDPADLDYLRDAIGLVSFLLDNGGVAVLDPQIIKWWRADDWRRQIFEPGPTAQALSRQVTILSSDDETTPGRVWLHTRGLRKFARPDLSLRGVPAQVPQTAVDLVRRFIGLQILGGQIPQERQIQMAGLPDGMVCRPSGSLEDPNFNNFHIDIRWPLDA